MGEVEPIYEHWDEELQGGFTLWDSTEIGERKMELRAVIDTGSCLAAVVIPVNRELAMKLGDIFHQWAMGEIGK